MRWLALVGMVAGCASAPELELVTSEGPLDLSGSERSWVFSDDVAYLNEDARQSIDIYYDVDAAEPLPLVIYLHGGAFVGGEKEHAFEYAEELVRTLMVDGYAVASVGYRLFDEVDTEGVLKPMNDARYALQFLRYYSESFNIDPDRVVLYGVSAGAGTAAWLNFTDDMADPDADDPVLGESTRPQGALLIETQGTYDIGRWGTDIFIDYNLNIMGAAAALGLEQMLMNFYGMSTLDAFESEEILDYRAEVDLLSLYTADDAPIFVSNVFSENVGPIDFNNFDLFHHPNHARELMERGEEIGAEQVVYIPKLDVEDPSGPTGLDFIHDRIGE